MIHDFIRSQSLCFLFSARIERSSSSSPSQLPSNYPSLIQSSSHSPFLQASFLSLTHTLWLPCKSRDQNDVVRSSTPKKLQLNHYLHRNHRRSLHQARVFPQFSLQHSLLLQWLSPLLRLSPAPEVAVCAWTCFSSVETIWTCPPHETRAGSVLSTLLYSFCKFLFLRVDYFGNVCVLCWDIINGLIASSHLVLLSFLCWRCF